ncbi:MAG: type I 3-dehydroquinate dehydratase [Bacillota bacterium]
MEIAISVRMAIFAGGRLKAKEHLKVVATKKPIKIGNVEIGGKKVLICIPITATTFEELELQLNNIYNAKPDLIEWRADYFSGLNPSSLISVLRRLKTDMPETPLIFTLRDWAEGGYRFLELSERFELVTCAIKSSLIDLLDIELNLERGLQKNILTEAVDFGVFSILSFHDFNHTPKRGVMRDKLLSMQDFGANIAKIAVTPVNAADVLELWHAVLEAKSAGLSIPVIGISMGFIGIPSRIVGGFFGSDIVFAAGDSPSAPGQIPFQTMRRLIDLIETL